MENGDIVDGNIVASSELTISTLTTFTYPARLARLNGDSTWVASKSDLQPWIQADIGYQTNVSGVVTQGDGEFGNWVTSMKASIFHMSTSEEEIFIKNTTGQVKVK